MRRVLEDLEAGEPLVLLGRPMGTYGSTAAAAWLSQAFFMVELPGAEGAIVRVLDAGVPGAETPTFDLALATAALASALSNREIWHRRKEGPPVAGRSRLELLDAHGGVAAALASRQEEDGTWGGPVETAWSVFALTGAADVGPFVRARIGEGWRRAGEEILSRWTGSEPGEDLSTVDRLHRAAAVSLAGRIAPAEVPGPGAPWYQRQFRGLDPGDDPDAWFAAGFLWMVLGPSADPDHPLQGCKSLLWQAYASGEVRSASAGGTLAMAMAIESFGWDAFGSVMGYLKADDWPPLDGN